MAPFRNPFARKPAPPGPKPPSGAEVLAEAIQKGAEKARARAEADGVEVDPMGDPVEQARAGRHPLGWCEACAENNRLIDVSGGF